MKDDVVALDLVLFSNLIHLALHASDGPKALALFSCLQGMGIKPNLKAYNTAITTYCKFDLLWDAKQLLLHDSPPTVSRSTWSHTPPSLPR
ncbi:hypothetical protein GUJ93_ZPchr0002g24736 [Zizania palustris]|uniref:Pentatricopeptide repeat-containing protein n=1 Tax=Zizania palustris TaxID=103762 RepID=A0A8J5SR50_ZIZPA|nr:hypothetical protein GUJ93_ZPchr0002g24736 [Zizania palustris]